MFSGLRGGMFMCSLSRLNKRIRNMLFQNLMKQEISFFEENKPGIVPVPSLKKHSQVKPEVTELFLLDIG